MYVRSVAMHLPRSFLIFGFSSSLSCYNAVEMGPGREIDRGSLALLIYLNWETLGGYVTLHRHSFLPGATFSLSLSRSFVMHEWSGR